MSTKPNTSQIRYNNGTVKDVLDDLTGPTGSVSVGYTPAGTGVVVATVQSKLRESVSVKDFGAVGDGVTDDTAAIQAALATGQPIYFPKPLVFYKLSSSITISTPFSAGLYTVFDSISSVVFNTNSVVEVQSRWFGDDGNAIQAAIIAAKLVKAVFISSGTWNVSTPIIIPDTSDYWGIQIRGIKNSSEYENLASSRSTILRATVAMNVVIGNRATWSASSGYYNKVMDLTINGNSLANYGYINGYEDILSGVTAANCLIAGIICGNLTNSTILQNVASVRNRHGLVLTGGSAGQTSTMTFANNVYLRQNFHSGLVLAQSYGSTFDGCVIESNAVVGISTFLATTGEDYASPLPFIGNFDFRSGGFESNPQTLMFDGTGAVVAPYNFNFKLCNFVGSSLADDFSFSVCRGFSFAECTFNNVVIKLGVNCSAFKISGAETDTYPTITGPSSANISTMKTRSDGSLLFDKVFYGSSTGIQLTKNATATLTNYDVFGTTLVNTGQAAVDLTLTLPGTGLASAPRTSPSFTYIVTTQQLANKIEFTVPAGSFFIIDGSQRTRIFNTATSYGLALRFTYLVITGTPFWFVDKLYGTWTTA